jgi:hypothetical protein
MLTTYEQQLKAAQPATKRTVQAEAHFGSIGTAFLFSL